MLSATAGSTAKENPAGFYGISKCFHKRRESAYYLPAGKTLNPEQKAGRCTGSNALVVRIRRLVPSPVAQSINIAHAPIRERSELANGFVTKNAMMIIFMMSWPTFFHHAVPYSNPSADPHLQK